MKIGHLKTDFILQVPDAPGLSCEHCRTFSKLGVIDKSGRAGGGITFEVSQAFSGKCIKEGTAS